MNPNRLNIILGLVIAVLLIVVAVGYLKLESDSENSLPDRAASVVEEQPQTATSSSSANKTTDWKTYSNSAYGYNISYPIKVSEQGEEWIVSVEGIATSFGPASSGPGGFIWSVVVFDKATRSVSTEDLEGLIRNMGKQFSDRKEQRENIVIDDVPATLVTITTNQASGWVYKAAYVEKDNKIYMISNGAIDSPLFTSFYQSFEFAN